MVSPCRWDLVFCPWLILSTHQPVSSSVLLQDEKLHSFFTNASYFTVEQVFLVLLIQWSADGCPLWCHAVGHTASVAWSVELSSTCDFFWTHAHGQIAGSWVVLFMVLGLAPWGVHSGCVWYFGTSSGRGLPFLTSSHPHQNVEDFVAVLVVAKAGVSVWF